MKLVKYLFAAALAVNICCLVGCSNPDSAYSKVTGTVTMEGAPLADCILTFFPQGDGGEGGSGKTDANGAFTVTSQGATNGGTGLKPGEYKVTAVKNSDIIDEDADAYNRGEIDYDEWQARKAKKGTYEKVEGGELLTPRQYSDPVATPLTVTVSKDPKQNVFELTLE